MPSIAIKNRSGSDVGSIDLSGSVFAAEKNPVVVREVYNAHMAARRQGTHKTKGWAEVSGGGKKPFKQKGTGRARQGSTRAPQWRGGAVIHGVTPRDYRQKVNRKKRRIAFQSVLTSRVEEGRFIVVDSLDFSAEPKTRKVVEFLDALGAEGRVLIVSKGVDEMLLRAAGNIPYVAIEVAGALSIYDLLVADTIVISREAAEALQENFA